MSARATLATLAMVLLAILVTADARGGLKDADYDARMKAFKRVLRPPPKDRAPDVEPALAAVAAFAGTRDARVHKVLFKALTPLTKLCAATGKTLDEVTEKLEQVRGPFFKYQEDYYREHGKFPTVDLKTRIESVETMQKKQEEAARLYDAWERIHEAVRGGLAVHLAALGDDRDEVWRSAKKLGAKSKKPDVRAAFAASLSGLPGDDVSAVLMEMEAGETDTGVLVVVLESLMRVPSRAAFERLKAHLDDARWPVVVAAVNGLARYRSPDTIPSLIARLKTANGRIRADLLDTLFDITGKHVMDTHSAWNSWWTTAGKEFLLRWSAEKDIRMKAIEDVGFADPKQIHVAAELAALLPTEPDAEVRLEIIDSLAIHRSGFARETLLAALRDPDKELRLAAIRGLAHYRHLSVPPALMRRVAPAEEDELLAIFQALRTLWGGADEFSVGRPDKEGLQRWWANNKSRVGRHLLTLGAKNIAAGKRAPKEAEGKWKDRNFYGLRIISKHVLFVIDISISMEEPAVKGKERKKIEVAKAELNRVIPALPDDATFGLLGFAATATLWGEGMTTATPDTRKRAQEWIAGLETRAATNIYDTLELCFKIGRRGTGYEGEGEPDTIFFVSDGAPTVGKMIDPDRILAFVRRANEGRGIKIHCIGVGEDHDVDFLRKLAEENQGHYVAR
jgi:HEAT repeat protein